MATGKISGDPITTTAVGVYMAAIQGGANIQAPSTLFAANQFNLADLSDPAAALTNLGGLSAALAASTYLTQANAAATYLTIANAAAGYQPLTANLTTWTAIARASGFDSFVAAPSSANLAALLTDETGTGAAVFATSPTLVTPALGTPSSAVLTNATGLPVSTGISGLAAGVASFLATPSSANLKTAVTDETGSGALVFATSPTLVTPALGTPASGVATNLTGLPLTTGVTGTLGLGNGGTGQITASAAFDALAPTTTRGDLIFRNATTNARLAASTAGYLLQTNGAGTDPTWVGFNNGGTGSTARTWNNKLIGLVDPYDFGAVGNGSTDDSTALQNAVNYCVTNKAILNLGNGSYKTSSSISITGAVTILGAGIFASKVLPTSTTKCFAINTTDAVIMRDFQITYTTTPSAGSNIPAIEVTAASNENIHSVFTNLYIGLPYIGFSFLKASAWTIEGCYFNTSTSSTGAIGVIVDNQNLIDSGDSVITGSTFFGAAPGGGVTTTGINWVGSGGLRVTNNKFNGQTTAFLGVLPANKATGDIFIFNNSMENLTTGFSFSSGATSSFNFIQISNNEIWAVNPVVINAGSATFLRGIIVTGNTFKFDNTAYGVRLIGAVSNFTISGNVFYSLIAGATGINVDAATDGAIGVNSYNSNVATHVVTNASPAVQQVGDLLLATYTASASATLSDIVNLTSAYRGFRIVWHNLIPATTGVNLQLQVYEAGAYVTTGYANAAGGATTYIDLFPGTTIANTAAYGCSGSVEIGEAASGTHARYISGKAVAGTSVPAISVLQIAGFHNASAAVAGFRIQFSSGNISSGTVQVFGVP